MDHETMKRKLFEFYDGALTGIERQQMATHLLQCAECRQAHASWQRTAAALFRRREPQASEAFVQQVLDRLPQSAPRRQVMPWAIRLRWLAPAAGLAALLFIMLRPSESAVSVDAMLLSDHRDQPSTQLVLASNTSSPDDVLGLLMEDSR